MGAAQVARWDRQPTQKGQTQNTQLWLTTSRPLEALGPAALNQAHRQEWGIQNGLHYVLDVSGDEDRPLRVRNLNSLCVLTLLGRLSVALWPHTRQPPQGYYSWREHPKARPGGLVRILCASP